MGTRAETYHYLDYYGADPRTYDEIPEELKTSGGMNVYQSSKIQLTLATSTSEKCTKLDIKKAI